MNLAKIALRPGLTTPDRLAFPVIGLDRADRWSHARLRAPARRCSRSTPPADGDMMTRFPPPACDRP